MTTGNGTIPGRSTKAFDAMVSTLVMGDDVRLDDDPEALAGLTESVRKHGVLQPLLVRPMGSTTYEVIAGRRRLAAARAAGLDRVPCVVRVATADDAFEMAIAENLHRRKLSPIEEALGYARMRDREGLSASQIAPRVGRHQTHVSMMLRLLNLAPNIQDLVHRGKMAVATALRPYRGGPTGKPTTTKGLSDDAATIISHWRRRHDRLVAGLWSIVRTKPEPVKCRKCNTVNEGSDSMTTLVHRLIRLDGEPLPTEAASTPEAKAG